MSDRVIETLLRLLRPAEESFVPLTGSEWDELVHQAVRHGVAPLLYSRVSESCLARSSLPARALGMLEDAFHVSSVRNLALLAELSKVLKTLRRKGIGVIVLKGAYLCSCVYQSPGHRVMSDLDLLVREGDLDVTARTLIELGFRAAPRPGLSEAVIAAHQHLAPHVKQCRVPVVVEVHRGLFGRDSLFPVRGDGLWTRARAALVAGAEALTLCPEDLLLHLCIHGSHSHGLAHGLRSVYDLHVLLERHGATIDGEQLVERANAWRAQRCLLLSLRLAERLLGTRLPEQSLETLEARGYAASRELEERAAEALLGKRLPERLSRLWEPATLSGKAAVLLATAFPSPSAIRCVCPGRSTVWLAIAWYPAHWAGLLRRYLGLMVRMLRGDRQVRKAARAEGSSRSVVRWIESG